METNERNYELLKDKILGICQTWNADTTSGRRSRFGDLLNLVASYVYDMHNKEYWHEKVFYYVSTIESDKEGCICFESKFFEQEKKISDLIIAFKKIEKFIDSDLIDNKELKSHCSFKDLKIDKRVEENIILDFCAFGKDGQIGR